MYQQNREASESVTERLPDTQNQVEQAETLPPSSDAALPQNGTSSKGTSAGESETGAAATGGPGVQGSGISASGAGSADAGSTTKGVRPQPVPLPARGQIHKRLRQPPQAPHRASLKQLILQWSRANPYGPLQTHNLAIPTSGPSFTT